MNRRGLPPHWAGSIAGATGVLAGSAALAGLGKRATQSSRPTTGWNALRALLLLVSISLIAGCGFHLRGAITIPAGLEPVFIQSGGPIGQAIEQRLQGSGVPVTSVVSQAGLVLRILGQSRSSRVVAVDRFGKALAYALELRVRFDAVDATGTPLISPQAISLERTFDDNPDVAVLGKQLESEIIYQDLIGDAADQVLMRLRAAIAARAS